jgi:glycosyltransferase involved in cell wall biosynthesis
MTRALFVASSGALGGAELALATYLRHLPATIDAHALVLGRGPLAALLAEVLGRAVAVAPIAGRPTAREAAAFTRGLTGHLRELRPDVVLATGIKAATLAAPAARAAPTPLVWHKVDLSHDARLARPLALLCAGVIPVGEAAATAIPARRRLPPIPPPVRLDPGFRVSASRPPAVIGSIGRLVPYKGHAHVVAAAARLRPRHPDLEVLIAGADEPSAPGHRGELERLARALEVPVRLLGHVEIEPVLEQLTVLAGPTYVDERGFGLEGFGLALAEGCWAGLPVVGTSPEVTRTGRLVPPGDTRALARAIGHFLDDHDAARAAGDAGAAWARAHLRPDRLANELAATLDAAGRRTTYPGAGAFAGQRRDPLP